MPWGKVLMIDEDIALRQLVSNYFAQRGIRLYSVSANEPFAEVSDDEIHVMIISSTAAENMTHTAIQEYADDHSIPIILTRSISCDPISRAAINSVCTFTKPFDIASLYDKVASLLPDAHSSPKPTCIQHLGLSVCVKTNTVIVDGKQMMLPAKETELLYMLLSEPDRFFSRAEISSRIWGRLLSDSRTISVHINRIRAKLGRYEANIISARGKGYMFKT